MALADPLEHLSLNELLNLLAAVDRLVHHATILEMNVESYRRTVALDRKRGPGRPPVHATPGLASAMPNELDKA